MPGNIRITNQISGISQTVSGTQNFEHIVPKYRTHKMFLITPYYKEHSQEVFNLGPLFRV